MNANETNATGPVVVAVCISPGGVPKLPQPSVAVGTAGLEGDGRDHAKHNKPNRAVSLFDEEILQQLCREGYELTPGSVGENVTLRGVNVQAMSPGTVLQMGDVQIRLEEPRKPCFVLDAIDPQLKHDIAGRCGYLASVVQGGELRPGLRVDVKEAATGDTQQ
jgi:MOSC domain-containing protein YiiM